MRYRDTDQPNVAYGSFASEPFSLGADLCPLLVKATTYRSRHYNGKNRLAAVSPKSNQVF